ncbi:IS66 family transposase [Ochrobactrum sp. MYb68]|nr:IS66 family transposase [Ochrobactrum sp. MYb68]
MQITPALDLSAIPAAQRAAVLALMEEVAALKDITRRQEHLIAELNHALHGKRSEKLSEDERQLAFEDLSIALAEVEAEKEARSNKASDGTTRPAPRRTIGNLPATLPRIEEIIEPDSLICPCGCGVMHKIGEDRSERLDIVPAQLRVIVTVRPKYACRICTDGVGKVAFHLKPVVDRLADHLKRSGKLFMDETTAPVLDPGRGTTKTGYLWALARDDRPWGGEDPPGVVYFYAPGRAGENAEAFLSGFDGILQVDGYQGYNRLTKPSRKGGSPIRVAHCWAHARRKLKEVFDRDGSEIAAEGLRRIAEFYAVEADIRGISPGQRLSARQTRTTPLVTAFGEWLQTQRCKVSAKSRLGEKLTYIHNQWHGLQTFLTDGRVEIDSNRVENLIRPIALNRKNALFAGHDEGGIAWGRIASLIETCKINDVEPFAYLKATLTAIAAGHPQSRLDDLLPWNFKTSS